ncbi:hypothetical protein [Streptomyces sp. NPDC017448]|uniref:hypothetical protein n=1 Tax=Streptomyces sp. NPDC017448 TaxID=3364996 RepID=UPI0037A3CAB5
MRTIDFLGRYVGLSWVKPRTPLIHRYELNEIDDECRTSHAFFVRLWPLRVVFFFGRWHDTGLTPEQMFDRVFTAHEIDLYDADGNLEERFERQARENVAQQAADPDEEWKLLQMLGLDE